MNLLKPLELEIYWKNDAACQLEQLGIPVDEQNGYKPETTLITFYSVDNVTSGTIIGIDGETGFITSGGQEFGTNMTYQELKNIIDSHL